MPQVLKPLCVQALVSESTMKALHVRILDWLTRLDVYQFNALIDAPGKEVTRSQLAAVVLCSAIIMSESLMRLVSIGTREAGRRESVGRSLVSRVCVVKSVLMCEINGFLRPRCG
jgi:hypothetical protein